eukprot:11756953-Alexandrium_andersonii.AAC.1
MHHASAGDCRPVVCLEVGCLRCLLVLELPWVLRSMTARNAWLTWRSRSWKVKRSRLQTSRVVGA